MNDWSDILAAVTPEDIRAAAELVLDSKADVTGWLLPDAPQTTAAETASEPAPQPAANPGETQ